MLFFCSLNSFAYTDSNKNNENKILIPVKKIHDNSITNYDRVDVDIYALLDNSSKIIEIDITADIGSGEIYITDSGSNVIDSTVFTGQGRTILSAPLSKGDYCLTVWSDVYYGEGIFTIK